LRGGGLLEPKTVEDYEAWFMAWRDRYGDDALGYSCLYGIVKSIVDLPGPDDTKVEEIRNAIAAFERLRDRMFRREKPADAAPAPAGEGVVV